VKQSETFSSSETHLLCYRTGGLGINREELIDGILEDPFCLSDLKDEQKTILKDIILDLELENNKDYLRRINSGNCYVFGDIHGDLGTLHGIIGQLKKIGGKDVIFLGDMIDRSYLENGGLMTLIYILLLRSNSDMNITMIRGNHEAYSLLEFFPYELPYEVQSYFHLSNDHPVYSKFLKIFDDLPLAAIVNGKIIAVHSGFPKKFRLGLSRSIDRKDILSFLWGEPVEYGIPRGPISYQVNFHHNDFKEFMEMNGLDLFIRGHDYNIKGCTVYGDRLYTIFSCSKYSSKGNQGIFLGHIIRSGDRNEIELLDYRDGHLHEVPFKSLEP
jgi:serine/threonine-protein phosphatase 6 catalytic subunit